VGVLVYVLLGSCAQATIGPTAVMGLLTFQTCGQDYPSCAILTGFYAGVFELLLAVLRLGEYSTKCLIRADCVWMNYQFNAACAFIGWVVSFISEPTTVGFTAGAAVTIMSSQIKSLFGMAGEKGEGFVGYWKAIFDSITTFKAGDTIVGVGAFICLMLLRVWPTQMTSLNYYYLLKWFLSISKLKFSFTET